MLHAIRDAGLRLDGLVCVRTVAGELLAAERRDPVFQFQGLGKREDGDYQFSLRLRDPDWLLRDESDYKSPSGVRTFQRNGLYPLVRDTEPVVGVHTKEIIENSPKPLLNPYLTLTLPV